MKKLVLILFTILLSYSCTYAQQLFQEDVLLFKYNMVKAPKNIEEINKYCTFVKNEPNCQRIIKLFKSDIQRRLNYINQIKETDVNNLNRDSMPAPFLPPMPNEIEERKTKYKKQYDSIINIMQKKDIFIIDSKIVSKNNQAVQKGYEHLQERLSIPFINNSFHSLSIKNRCLFIDSIYTIYKVSEPLKKLMVLYYENQMYLNQSNIFELVGISSKVMNEMKYITNQINISKVNLIDSMKNDFIKLTADKLSEISKITDVEKKKIAEQEFHKNKIQIHNQYMTILSDRYNTYSQHFDNSIAKFNQVLIAYEFGKNATHIQEKNMLKIVSNTQSEMYQTLDHIDDFGLFIYENLYRYNKQ